MLSNLVLFYFNASLKSSEICKENLYTEAVCAGDGWFLFGFCQGYVGLGWVPWSRVGCKGLCWGFIIIEMSCWHLMGWGKVGLGGVAWSRVGSVWLYRGYIGWSEVGLGGL